MRYCWCKSNYSNRGYHMTYDAIIIGSGAGGCAAAFQLTQSGAKVLLLEKGERLPKDGSTLDVETVAKRKLFIDDDPWHDRMGNVIVPQERSNLGGKTKWYGAALLRFAPHEFNADPAHQCLAWPIDYEALEPYYEAAERVLGVRHFAIEPDFQRIANGLRSKDARWKKQPLPVGLSSDILSFPLEAKHFDAFASPRGLKADGESRFLERIANNPNLQIATGKRVTALRPASDDPTCVTEVECEDGTRYRGATILLAAGALHSPRLLQTYFEAHGLDQTLPSYAQIGRNYKFHLLTAMLMLTARKQTDILRKTTVLTHDDLPHSSVQPLGWMDGELLAPELPGFVPRWAANLLGRRVYGFFLQTEDGSHPDNRVITRSDHGSLPCLDYDSARVTPARDEHRRFVRLMQQQLLTIGYIGLTKPIPITGTAHACGTLVAGDDPAKSVVDANGKVHGMKNVYVVDGSVLPRSSRVNPALTIYAWALRVAGRLNHEGENNECVIAQRDPIRA